jgi:hypothetical protein
MVSTLRHRDIQKQRFGLPPIAFALLAVLLLGTSGCAVHHRPYPSAGTRFRFPQDTFAYANELVWEYRYDESGKWTTTPRVPKPDYTLHCYVLARSARQFLQHARFDAALPVVDDGTYRRLVRRVVSTSPRKRLPDEKKIVIPGYTDLLSFSRAREALLKEECGSASESYFQRGNWRLVFPFSRSGQKWMAEHLQADLHGSYPVVVHVGRFPQLSINHAMLLYAVEETEREIRFTAYDPNYPEEPANLVFDRASRTFNLPPLKYFQGGRVDVYELYCSWNY